MSVSTKSKATLERKIEFFCISGTDTEDNPVVTYDENKNPLSRVLDKRWDFSAERIVGTGKKTFLSLETDIVDKQDVLTVRRIFHLFYKENNDLSISSLNIKFRALCWVFRYIRDLNLTSPESLTETASWAAFKRKIKDGRHADTMVGGILSLSSWLSGRTLTSKDKVKSIAKSRPKGVKQAIALPEDMGGEVLAKAVEIVEEFHPYRHDISNISRKCAEGAKAHDEQGLPKSSFISKFRKENKGSIPPGFTVTANASHAIKIQTACFIVLLGFSGIRDGEGKSTNPNSYKEKKIGKTVVSLLKAEITKTEESGTPVECTWVTHAITKKALELAYDMSAFAREHYLKVLKNKSNSANLIRDCSSAFLSLAINVNTCESTVINGKFARLFPQFLKDHHITFTDKDVSEFDVLNPYFAGTVKPGEHLAKFSPHDLRRTYASFLIKNKLTSLLSLKSQFKHANLFMTAWYAQNSELAAELDMDMDVELQAMIASINQSVTAMALFDIHNSKVLSGKEGERIQSERGDYYAGEVYMSYEEALETVKANNISIVEHPTGYCVNPSCERICSDEKSLNTCQHEIVTDNKAQEVLLPQYYRLVKKFNALNTEDYYLYSVLKDIKFRLKSLEITLSKHNIKFTKAEDLSIQCKSIMAS
ncbi:hypothetical protein [Vibrio vulnificus]|uniref:hypothetical protein n=1 Tax=Vibrio vulnificus TaxID=672 RepID=UPI0021129828|nr:hypothetical protein [Vibrio vulnificus]